MNDNLEKCILCGKEHNVLGSEKIGYNSYKCEKRPCLIHESVLYGCSDLEKEHRLNAVDNYLLYKPLMDNNSNYWWFYYEDKEQDTLNDAKYVNVYNLMKSYPKTIVEKIDSIMLNLYKLYPLLSDTFKISDMVENKRLFYSDNTYKRKDEITVEMVSLHAMLHNLSYIELRAQDPSDPSTKEYAVTYKGLQKIDELLKNKSTSRQIFIAMSFADSNANIEKALKDGILKAGFSPQIIKDKEHNNYIMPEIFYEIDKSPAIVVEITDQNCGAYYEAGYALGRGKEVIVCCKESVFHDKDIEKCKKPHFDIYQKSMILWNDENDLVEKLKRRINATINI